MKILRAISFVAVLAVVVAGAGCNSVESPLHPPLPPAGYTGPFNEAFSSNVAVQGRATRSFVVQKDGLVTLTLISAGPPSNVVLGLGLGIPRIDGTGCNLNTVVSTAAGSTAQISMTVDKGTYCLSVYDLGTLQNFVSFSVAIFHP